MTLLFGKGNLADKIRKIIQLTYEHTKNLALFVGVYKTALLSLRS